RQNLCERHRVEGGVRDRVRALEAFEQIFRRRAGARSLNDSIFDDLILTARRFDRSPQLGVLFDGNSLKRRKNDGGNVRELRLQLFSLSLLFGLLLHAELLSILLDQSRRLPLQLLPLPRGQSARPGPWSRSA